MQKESVTIELGKDKLAVLTLTPFDTDIDVDDLTIIHHHNIIGEILTCPVLLNRIGNLLAEVEALLAHAKIDFEIFFAQKEEHFRKEMTNTYINSRGTNKVEPPTNTAVEMAIIRTLDWKVKKKHIITLQKNRDIVNSWYWAIKDKSDKVNKISDKLRPEEFEKEILEGTINGIQIKVQEKSVKSARKN